MLFVEGEVLDVVVHVGNNGREYGRAVLTNGLATVNVDIPADRAADVRVGESVRWPVIQRVVVPGNGNPPFAALRAVKVG